MRACVRGVELSVGHYGDVLLSYMANVDTCRCCGVSEFSETLEVAKKTITAAVFFVFSAYVSYTSPPSGTNPFYTNHPLYTHLYNSTTSYDH